MRVLVVDDDQAVLDVMALSLLEAWPDCELACFLSAAEALRQLSTFDPDIVLLDIGLPEITGHEVLGRIRRSPTSRSS